MFKLLFFMILFSTSAAAQLIDLRARSVHTGGSHFAHSPVQQYRPSPQGYYRVPQQAQQQAPQLALQSVPLSMQNSVQAPLKQGKLKMFLPKDEARVLNFKIDNPDFDRLSNVKKQDILRRIIIEEK